MDYGIVLNKLTTSTSTTSNYINSTDASKIIYERGTSASINSMMYSYFEGSYNKLAYKAIMEPHSVHEKELIHLQPLQLMILIS